MKRKGLKIFLTMAMVYAIFMGKSSEAKAYTVVNGEAWMTEDEYFALEANRALPKNMSIRIAEVETDIVNADLEMMDYVSEENFDYDWYLQKHPELLATCGTDKKAVYSFYETTGIYNGWRGRVAFDKLVNVYSFDAARYAADYPDLAATFGQDAAALYTHYVTVGMKEGRNGYSTNETTNAYIKVYEVASQITNDDMTDREKVKAVHDWMCLHMAYDYDNYYNGTIPEESYEITGAMNKGIVVCSGYMRAFKAFMDVLGIDCTCITGTANGGSHGWNKVQVDGEYYYIDVTWDDVNGVRYDYYLTKDPTFGGDHVPEEY